MHLLFRFNLCLLFAVTCSSPVVGAADLNTGLLFHLPLQTDLRDHSPRQLAVGVTNRVEIRDGAAWFSGENSWLELPHVDFNGRPFTVALWLKVTGQHPMYGLLEQKGEKAINRWLHLMLRGGRQPYVGFYVNDGISPLPLNAGQWAHVAFQFNGTHQYIWINGQLVCTRRSAAYAGTSGTTQIGKTPRWNNVPSRDFEGYLRDVRAYDRALSVDEIALLATPTPDMGVVRALLPRQATAVSNRSATVLTESNALAAQVGVPFLSVEGRKLVVTGESNQIYEVQVSENLSGDWQPLVVLTNRTGRVEFNDDAAKQAAGRYYRIKVR